MRFSFTSVKVECWKSGLILQLYLAALVLSCMGCDDKIVDNNGQNRNNQQSILQSEDSISISEDRFQQEELSAEQLDMIEQLNAIGYLGGTQPVPTLSGLIQHDEENTCNGLNLYIAGHAPKAYLIDMQGDLLHTWAYTFEMVWPERYIPEDSIGHLNWRRAYLYDNGDLLAIFEGYGLIKIDKNSELIWEFPGNAHHDLKVMDDGDIYVLSRKAHVIPRIHAHEPILEDFVTILDPHGNVKRQVSILEAAEQSDFWPVISSLVKESGDLFHTNTLEYLDGTLEHISPYFKKGNILTVLREIHALAIIDMELEEIVWFKLGTWSGPHQPILLPNANIILFDNNRFSDYSRVLEIEPFTENIVWYYIANPPNSFFTEACGSIQPLPNGNILVIESQAGRAFEIQRNGSIVWEYVVPHVLEGIDQFIPYLFDLVRIEPDFLLDWLD